MFVNFNPLTGDILNITNIEPDFDYIKVDIEDIRAVHIGKESLSNYHVLYDKKEESYKLQKKNILNVFDKKFNEIVYEIPLNLDRSGITVIQSIEEKCWKFVINKDLEIQLRNNKSYINYNLFFSITEYGNPNILYRQLEINLEQLVKNHYQIIPFEFDFEKTLMPVSVFTNKMFEYNYERN